MSNKQEDLNIRAAYGEFLTDLKNIERTIDQLTEQQESLGHGERKSLDFLREAVWRHMSRTQMCLDRLDDLYPDSIEYT